MNTQDLQNELLEPHAYRGMGSRVEHLQTHISDLYFVGDRVYKVKRAVDLGFLDFTTLERRKFFCEEELRLNRRLSPEVYLEVVPIVIAEDGRPRVRGEGTPIEWAVEMQRLPAEAMLDARLEAGDVDNQLVRELARLLADFHGRAATGAGVDEFGRPGAVQELVRSTLAKLEPFVEPAGGEPGSEVAALSSARLEFLRRSTADFLESQRDLLERRVRAGRIRDGHGDLHAGNICYRREGIAIYDCIEFSEAFRCSDVACDLAFLAMDLDFRGFHAFAAYLVHEYQQAAGDSELSTLLPFYKQYRAVVRGMVACVTAAGAPEQSKLRLAKLAEARRYLDLATAYSLPPCLALMSGLPGSGKSTIARGLARPLNAVVHRSDVRRRSEAPAPVRSRVDEGFSQGLYAPDQIRRTYASLLEATVHDLEHGRSVVVDATFSKRARREEFLRAAEQAGVPVYVVETFASEAVTRERMRRRAEDPNEASTADFEVYLEARKRFEAPDELPEGALVRVDTESVTGEQAATLLLERRIRARSLRHR